LVNVTVKMLVPPAGTLVVTENALATLIALTFKVAFAAAVLFIPCVVVNPPAGIVFGYAPVEVLVGVVTVAVTVHVPYTTGGVVGVALAGIVPPLKTIDVAVLLAVFPPTQVVVGVPEMVKPVGSASVNAAPV
jgi:hypothetical protein